MLMQFKKIDNNKFMATNAGVELDIVVGVDGFGVFFTVETANHSNTFTTWEKAVRFAECEYGIREVFDEDAYLELLALQDSDGFACLSNQI